MDAEKVKKLFRLILNADTLSANIKGEWYGEIFVNAFIVDHISYNQRNKEHWDKVFEIAKSNASIESKLAQCDAIKIPSCLDNAPIRGKGYPDPDRLVCGNPNEVILKLKGDDWLGGRSVTMLELSFATISGSTITIPYINSYYYKDGDLIDYTANGTMELTVYSAPTVDIMAETNGSYIELYKLITDKNVKCRNSDRWTDDKWSIPFTELDIREYDDVNSNDIVLFFKKLEFQHYVKYYITKSGLPKSKIIGNRITIPCLKYTPKMDPVKGALDELELIEHLISFSLYRLAEVDVAKEIG